MNNSIYPCLAFEGRGREAAEFYCNLFQNSKMINDTQMVVQFEIEGKKVMGLNSGPQEKISPALSFFVTCETEEEINKLYTAFHEGGQDIFPLGKYPWAEKYASVTDRFGMTWQLMLGELQEGQQKIILCFLFVGSMFGKAQDAVKFYTSIFPHSSVFHLEIAREDEAEAAGSLKFGHFALNTEMFSAMDGPPQQNFKFTDGLSIMVECETQSEIDRYWSTLTDGGEESMCGWLKDKFGVSWQIAPKQLGALMKDPEKFKRVIEAVSKMRKIDLQTLVDA